MASDSVDTRRPDHDLHAAKMLGSNLRKRGFDDTENRFRPDPSGNRFVAWDRDGLRVTVGREQPEWFVNVGGIDWNVLYSEAEWHAVIRNEFKLVHPQDVLTRSRRLIDNIDQIDNLVRADKSAVQRQLNDWRAERTRVLSRRRAAASDAEELGVIHGIQLLFARLNFDVVLRPTEDGWDADLCTDGGARRFWPAFGRGETRGAAVLSAQRYWIMREGPFPDAPS